MTSQISKCRSAACVPLSSPLLQDVLQGCQPFGDELLGELLYQLLAVSLVKDCNYSMDRADIALEMEQWAEWARAARSARSGLTTE